MAVAYAGRVLNIPVTVVVPQTTAEIALQLAPNAVPHTSYIGQYPWPFLFLTHRFSTDDPYAQSTGQCMHSR